MTELTRYITANIIQISTNSIDEDISLLAQNSQAENVIIDLIQIDKILTVIWFRKLRANLALYNKTLIGACNPGICLENLKAASIPIVDPQSLQTSLIQPVVEVVAEPVQKNTSEPSQENFRTIIHHGHLRGGQSISNPYGDIIIAGNLNHGAEVMAGGHVHILGALNGRALAGSYIGSKAIISAYSMQAELISIDGYYLSSDEIKPQTRPITILLQNEKICIRSIENA